ncbi:hypothetical protein TNCV_3072371 [Trichonephila clavipes]|nr:hypothetical protein TNCV_3072371 [Trichonephila clavipes]
MSMTHELIHEPLQHTTPQKRKDMELDIFNVHRPLCTKKTFHHLLAIYAPTTRLRWNADDLWVPSTASLPSLAQRVMPPYIVANAHTECIRYHDVTQDSFVERLRICYQIVMSTLGKLFNDRVNRCN